MKMIYYLGILMASVSPVFGDVPSSRSEVIIVIPLGCGAGEVNVDFGDGGSACINRALLDFLFGAGASTPGVVPEPGGGGPQGGVPGGGGDGEQEDATEETCAAAYEQCAVSALDKQEKCISEKALQSAAIANRNLTCHGNEEDLANDIFVPESSPGGGNLFRRCTLDDLEGTNLASQLCQYGFRRQAIRQCMSDFNQQTLNSGESLSAEFDVGFGNVGLGGEASVSVLKPGGTGYRTACAALGKAAEDECAKTKDACMMAAEGAQPLVIQPAGPNEIIERIDQQRLNLVGGGVGIGGGGEVAGDPSPFRPISKGRLEMAELYEIRMEFLADWSTFLTEENIQSDVQKLAQILFERAQRTVAGAADDFVTLFSLVLAVDPRTGRAGTDVEIEFFRDFVRDREFERRSDAGEEALMRDLGGLFGPERLERFGQRVWPGIQSFGLAAPMTPKQVPVFE